MNFLEFSSNTKQARRAFVAVIVCSLMLVLPGCGIPQLRGPFAARDMPPTYNGVSTEDNSSQVSIEEFFNDPFLVDLMHQGMTGSLQLKILGEEIQIADNEVLKRRGAYLPFFTVGGSPRLDQFSRNTLLGADNTQNVAANGQHFPMPLPDFLTSVNVSWQIDIWRQLRNSRDAACLRYLGTIEGRNYVVTRFIAEIAENYYNLLALDKRIENLDRIISFQEASLERARALKVGAQGTELGIQRFTAEVRKNQSEKLILNQEIIETENRINFLIGRYPQTVARSSEFYNLNLHDLRLGVPSELLLNRPDIREAEKELGATGLDIKVARAAFYPRGTISASVGYEAFNPRYLFLTPESLVGSIAGDLVSPLINKFAIKADFMTANARQLQAIYDYQRTVLNAYTEVINRWSMVQNYSTSIEIKQKQLDALEASVDISGKLFQAARVQYMDVLFAQRDLADARMVLIDTKRKQLTAIVDTYQALGGGLVQFESYPTTTTEPVEATLPAPVQPAEGETPPAPEVPENADQNKD